MMEVKLLSPVLSLMLALAPSNVWAQSEPGSELNDGAPAETEANDGSRAEPEADLETGADPETEAYPEKPNPRPKTKNGPSPLSGPRSKTPTTRFGFAAWKSRSTS